MSETAPHLLLLCHSGAWDRLYQACSAAASASAVGQGVVLVFFFEALKKLVEQRLDEVSGPSEGLDYAQLKERAQEAGTTPVSELLRLARKSQKTRVLACSASVKLGGHEHARVAERVDEIVGWPTVTSIMSRATHVLYL